MQQNQIHMMKELYCSYPITQATRAASRGVRPSKIEQRISSGRTRRSPTASVLRSLWLWDSIQSNVKFQLHKHEFNECSPLFSSFLRWTAAYFETKLMCERKEGNQVFWWLQARKHQHQGKKGEHRWREWAKEGTCCRHWKHQAG